jgi:hypothetical protein
MLVLSQGEALAVVLRDSAEALHRKINTPDGGCALRHNV